MLSKPAVLICVLVFVTAGRTDWTSMVEVRGGRQRNRLLPISAAIKLSLSRIITHIFARTHTATHKETNGVLLSIKINLPLSGSIHQHQFICFSISEFSISPSTPQSLDITFNLASSDQVKH